MTSTSQPKLVNHATMPEMGSSLLSVILVYQTVLFLPWKTILSRRRQLYDATEPVARPQPVPRTAQRKNTSASCQEEARNQAYEYMDTRQFMLQAGSCGRLAAFGAPPNTVV